MMPARHKNQLHLQQHSAESNTMFIARRVFKRCRGGEGQNDHLKTSSRYGDGSHSPTTNTCSSVTLRHEDEYGGDQDDSEGAYMYQPAKRYRMERTPFPDFDLPDTVEVTDTSSDEESVMQRDEEYRTKEDEDVAVFLNLTKRMSLQSLLHLLQGAAKAQNNIMDAEENPMMEYNVLLSYRGGLKGSTAGDAQSSPSVAKEKKFRFAEISENRVREVVHEVESYKDIPELWWSEQEMMEIRADKIRVVKHFRKHRPTFIQSVELLVKGTETKEVLEDHMRRLTEDSFARGLETHSVRCISDRRKSHSAAVLQEQEDCRDSGDTYEVAMHCLREQSLAYSQLLTDFALRMAKCDHIDALKASMSTWETPEPMFCD